MPKLAALLFVAALSLFVDCGDDHGHDHDHAGEGDDHMHDQQGGQ